MTQPQAPTLAPSVDVKYATQAEWPLGMAVWEQGVGWVEYPQPDLSFGERIRLGMNCVTGYPECPFQGKSHQHDMERTVHGHVLTFHVDSPDNQFGQSLWSVSERSQTRSGGTEHIYFDDRHAWNDPDADGHDCVDCRPDDSRKCDRLGHADPSR